MNISFIGGGNMATAIIGGLIKQNFSPLQISVVEVDAIRRQSLVEEFGVTVTENFSDGIQHSEIVMLAVKPQQLHDVSIQAAGLLRDKLIISIAAGCRVRDNPQQTTWHCRVVPETTPTRSTG